MLIRYETRIETPAIVRHHPPQVKVERHESKQAALNYIQDDKASFDPRSTIRIVEVKEKLVSTFEVHKVSTTFLRKKSLPRMIKQA